MKTLTAILTAVALVGAGSALADEALVMKHKCNVCHDLNVKKVGPSWKAIAAKNQGVKPEELAETIVKGSKGKYGPIPMPPQPAAKADSVALAKWILSQH
jgi:cytochrome c